MLLNQASSVPRHEHSIGTVLRSENDMHYLLCDFSIRSDDRSTRGGTVYVSNTA